MGKATIGMLLATLFAGGSAALPPMSAEYLQDSRKEIPEADFVASGYRKGPLGLVWKYKGNQIFVGPGTTRISQIDNGTVRCEFELPATLQLTLAGVKDIFKHLGALSDLPKGESREIVMSDQKGRSIKVKCIRTR